MNFSFKAYRLENLTILFVHFVTRFHLFEFCKYLKEHNIDRSVFIEMQFDVLQYGLSLNKYYIP